MVNMKKTEKEKKDYAEIAKGPRDEYPWGLTINLDNDSLKKLGIKESMPMGKKLTLTAKVEVCSASSRETDEGAELSMSFQITDMEFEAGSTKEEQAGKLYKK